MADQCLALFDCDSFLTRLANRVFLRTCNRNTIVVLSKQWILRGGNRLVKILVEVRATF